MSNVIWGTFTFSEGFKTPEGKTLIDLARKGGDDLLHVVNRLLKSESEVAHDMAEELFDKFA